MVVKRIVCTLLHSLKKEIKCDVSEFADSMYLLIVESHYCVMRFACALHMRPQNLVFSPYLYIEPIELVIEVIFHYCTTPPSHNDDDCFYYYKK